MTPDNKRRTDCLNTVAALNNQFAGWIERQNRERPFDLWRGGVQDYLKHAEKILENFQDVVDWLNSSLGQNGSLAGASNPPQDTMPSEPHPVKSTAVENIVFKGWGTTDSGSKEKAATANGAPKEQPKLFAWAPVVKSAAPDAIGKGDVGKAGSSGLATKEKEAGGGTERLTEKAGPAAPPGWGAGFGASAEAKKAGGGVSSGGEGSKDSLFETPIFSAAEGPKSTAIFPASAFLPPSRAATPPEQAPPSTTPSSLFTVPAFLPPGQPEPPKASAGQSTPSTSEREAAPPSLFSVPAFSTPAPIKTSLEQKPPAKIGGGIDWAAGFSKPVSVFGGGPSFSLPGASSLLGAAPEEGKGAGADEGEKKEVAEEGEAPAEPPSPSFKAAEEEGVENVLETPIRVYRKGTGPEGKWEDQGNGTLTVKRDKGAPLGSKGANARVVFRNPGGKVLLNARLYVGMRVDLQNGAVSTFLHSMETRTPVKSGGDDKEQTNPTTEETRTSGEGGDSKKQAEPITEVVGRAYAFRRPKKGGMAAEELKAALEKEVPREQVQNAEDSKTSK